VVSLSGDRLVNHRRATKIPENPGNLKGKAGRYFGFGCIAVGVTAVQGQVVGLAESLMASRRLSDEGPVLCKKCIQ
jgi:hypothetical protein